MSVCAAFVITVVVALMWFIPVVAIPTMGRDYTFNVQAFDAETGEFFWRADLPPYAGPAAKGDAEGYLTRRWLGVRTVSLPSAASYPILDAQGIMYFGYMDGHLYKIKDWNGDGIIDKNTELCRFDMGTTSFTGGPSIAPG